MPLRRGSTSRQEKERIFRVWLLRGLARFFEDKARLAINGKEAAILEQTSFGRNRNACVETLRSISFTQRPLDSSAFIKHSIVADACDVIWHVSRNLFEHLEDCLRRRPSAKYFT